jgi:D-glycero-D-manno-heptose 1,7-bisphosphate phosphatase
MIGDRWRDVAAGLSAGCKTIFIDCGYCEKRPEIYDYRVKTLLEAATLIIDERSEGSI